MGIAGFRQGNITLDFYLKLPGIKFCLLYW